MRCSLICAAVVTALVGAGSTWADDKKETEVEKALSKIAQLGGVHPKKDAKGRITSCVVVGQSRISTVLGKAEGLQNARTKARQDASAEFVKWLKEKVSVHENSDKETILFTEGSEENDKEALKESGKTVDKTSKKFESISQGQVRGLQVLHLEVSANGKTYTLVFGWSAENAKAVEKIEKGADGKDEPKAGDPKKSDEVKKPDEVRKPIDKKIEDKKVTSDDAKKFLP